MALPKRIDHVENLNEHRSDRNTQQKVVRLKSFDARRERRDPLPVQVYLASLEEPRTREQTVTEDVSPHGARVLTRRCWNPGEVPLLTPLIGEYPKHARVVYCIPQPNGGYFLGIEFEGPTFRWRA